MRRRLELGVAVPVGAVDVDEGDVGDAAPRQATTGGPPNGSSSITRLSLMSMRSVPIRPRVGRNGRLRAPGAEPGVERRLRQLLDPDLPGLDRLAVLLAQAELLHRHRGADQPVEARRPPPASRRRSRRPARPGRGCACSWRMSSRTGRHRRRLRRHVLQGDDVAVVDVGGDRLLERDDLVDVPWSILSAATVMISRPPCTSMTWPVT